MISLSESPDGGFRDLIKQLTNFLQSPDVKALILGIGEGVGGFFRWLAQPENQASIKFWIEKIGRFTKALAIGVTVIKAIAFAAQLWAARWAILNAVLMVNPWFAIGAALVALGTLIYTFWPEISSFITGWWEWLKEKMASIWGGITAGAKSYWQELKLIVTNPVQFMIDKIRDFLTLAAKIPGVGKLASSALGALDAVGAERSDVRGISGLAVDAAEAFTSSTTAEVTIRSEAGRADVTRPPSGPGLSIATSGGR